MDKVKWLDWSPEIFLKAERENKLILLDITAAWCHWCHVMEEESYSNPEIVHIIHKSYLPVRVRYDERPDINDRYNQGGWPSTVILSSDGFIVHGTTYLPPSALEELLSQARSWYDENRTRVSDAAKAMAAEITRPVPPATVAPEPDAVKDLSAQMMEDILKNADRVNGGFGSEAKFPQAAAISLVLAQFYRARDPELLEFAETTLRNMKEGLLDKEAGGMFRYSISPEWDAPQYEKNLSVNAECLQNYLDACRMTDKKEYAEAAQNIIRYVCRTLADPEGGFYGSQDADIFDEDSVKVVMEGEAYYKLPLAERRKCGEPTIDKTLYVNWNALTISALLDAYHVVGNADYRNVALKSLRRLMKSCVDSQASVCHFLRNGKKGPALLGDAVALARANLDAYETTAEIEYLENGRKLMEAAQERYAAADGGFYDSATEAELPPAVRIRHKPLNDNLLAVEVLARLYNYTTDSTYLLEAVATLLAFEGNVQALLAEGSGYFAAEYVLAAQFVREDSTKVAILGSLDDEHARDLLHKAKRLYRPAKIVQLLDPKRDKALIAAMGYGDEKKLPVVHICTEKGCVAPVTTADKMIQVLSL